MPKETYPVTGVPLKVVIDNANPEYGQNRAEWEEHVFRRADHFNVVRFNAGGGSEIATVKNFVEALFLAHGKERHLIYVAALNGDAFCMSPNEYERFAQITLEMRGETP